MKKQNFRRIEQKKNCLNKSICIIGQIPRWKVLYKSYNFNFNFSLIPNNYPKNTKKWLFPMHFLMHQENFCNAFLNHPNEQCIKNRLILMKFVFYCDCLFIQSVESYSTLKSKHLHFNPFETKIYHKLWSTCFWPNLWPAMYLSAVLVTNVWHNYWPLLKTYSYNTIYWLLKLIFCKWII